MLALISPAKKLDTTPAPVPAHSQPELLDQTEMLMRTARKLKVADLKRLMKLSDKLAELNVERFQAFDTPFTPENALPAVTTFAGDVYLGLDARSLTAEDLAWAQDHVGILSGLYGMLRPLDLMQPYRLEMGTSLRTRRGKNLYDFWGNRIRKWVAAHAAADETVLNLASKEYATAARLHELKQPVITPVFKDIKDGKARVLSFFAKRARGTMVRWMIQHRCTAPQQLMDFDGDDYRYDEALSDGNTWVFSRQQPPPIAEVRKAQAAAAAKA